MMEVVRISETSVDILHGSTSQKTILMMMVVRTSETSVYNNFTRQYIPEDNSDDGGSTHLWNVGLQ
jgi:hypothetical protein